MTAKRRQSASGKKRSKKSQEKVDEGEYEVETILDERVYTDGTKDYLIHWQNYTIEESTWQEDTDLCCAALLREFKKVRQSQVAPIVSVIHIVNVQDGSMLARVADEDGEEFWRHECNLSPDLITSYLDKVAAEAKEGKVKTDDDENANAEKDDVDVKDEESRKPKDLNLALDGDNEFMETEDMPHEKAKEEDSHRENDFDLMDDDLDVPKKSTRLNKRTRIESDNSDDDVVYVNSEKTKNEFLSGSDEEMKSKKARKGEIVDEQRELSNEAESKMDSVIENKGVPEEKIAEHPFIISCVWCVNEMAILSNGRKVFWVDHRVDELHINARDWVDQEELTIQNCSAVLLYDLHLSIRREMEIAERNGADCTRLNQLLTELLAFMKPWIEAKTANNAIKREKMPSTRRRGRPRGTNPAEVCSKAKSLPKGSSDKGKKIQEKSAVGPLETPSKVLEIFDLHTSADGRRVFSVLHEDQSLSTMDYDLVKKQYPNKLIDYYEHNTTNEGKPNSSRIEDTSGEQAAATSKETIPLKFATVADLLADDNLSNELMTAPAHVNVDKKEADKATPEIDLKTQEARGSDKQLELQQEKADEEKQIIRDILQLATSEIAEDAGADNIQQVNETVSAGAFREVEQPVDVPEDDIIIVE